MPQYYCLSCEALASGLGVSKTDRTKWNQHIHCQSTWTLTVPIGMMVGGGSRMSRSNEVVSSDR